ITRTYAGNSDSEFAELVGAVDGAQRGLAAKVRPGQSYPELHLEAHHALGGILREHGFIRMSPESAVESGVSSAFFPHGLGHLIDWQGQDLPGSRPEDSAGYTEKPPGPPSLRLRRALEPRMVTTIEPGLYFIDMLLAELKGKPHAADVDWERVDRFRRY